MDGCWNPRGSTASPSTGPQWFPPLLQRSVASVTDLQSPPLIAMINAANSARRWSSTTQVAAPGGPVACDATQSCNALTVSQPAGLNWTHGLFYNSRDLLFATWAYFDLHHHFLNYCVQTWMRLYCDKEAWESKSSPTEVKVYIQSKFHFDDNCCTINMELWEASWCQTTLCSRVDK